MSDEDSFVILGSTPTPSMDSYSMSGGEPNHDLTPTTSLQPTGKLLSLLNQESEPAASLVNQPFSILQHQDGAAELSVSPYQSLAEQFLLGKINVDSLKLTVQNTDEKIASSTMQRQMGSQFTSIAQHFPSMCTPQSSDEDMQKLESLICEHLELKDNLEKTNIAMRQHFSLISQWHSNVMHQKKEHAAEIGELTELKNKLQKEILQINDDHTHEIDSFKTMLSIAQKENAELVKEVSNNKAMIQNMHSELAKLHKDTDSYSLMHDSTNTSITLQPRSVDIEERNATIEFLKEELSKAIAENLELQDMKTIYVDQVNCLQVNMVAAEELLNKARCDINLLQLQETENRSTVADNEKHATELMSEIDVLKAQLEIFRNDFEMERSARQDLASEREDLLTDLKLLQRRNQQLIDESQARSIRDAAGPLSQVPKPTLSLQRNEPRLAQFICPVCSRTYVELKALESHVNDCLLNQS